MPAPAAPVVTAIDPGIAGCLGGTVTNLPATYTKLSISKCESDGSGLWSICDFLNNDQGETFVFNGGTKYVTARVTDSGGTSAWSTPVQLVSSAGAPTLSQHEHFELAMDGEYNVGDSVGGFTITVEKTINADGTIS